ncbi:MAG: hypothetical protein HY717_15875 [Planctomycetes bacterium]|nr:hypothetical protein [Planctomycetota bacterium]
MRFGDSYSQNFRKIAPREPSWRLIILGIFAVLIVAIGFGFRHLQRTLSDMDRPVDIAERHVSKFPPGQAPVMISPEKAQQGLPPPPPLGEPRPFSAQPGLLQAVAAADQTSRIAEPALDYLFQKIRTDPNWTREFPPQSWKDPAAAWQQFIQHPPGHRGEEICLEGALISAERGRSPLTLEGLSSGALSGLDRYYQSYLYAGGKLFLVATWRPPAEVFEDHDEVRLRAQFLQVYQNDIVHQGKLVKAAVPLIVGDSFTRLPPPELQLIPPSAQLLLIFLGAVLLVYGTARYILRRGNRRFDEKLKEMRSRLAEKKHPGGTVDSSTALR